MKAWRFYGFRDMRLDEVQVPPPIGKRDAMDHERQSRSSDPAMAGPAFTVRVHTADTLMVSQGHVLVIDARKGADPGNLLHVDEKIERKRGEIFIPQPETVAVDKQ